MLYIELAFQRKANFLGVISKISQCSVWVKQSSTISRNDKLILCLLQPRRNLGKTTGSAFCVVDPAITECNTMGFAAFLLYTLDYITICSALGIKKATVLWKACNSVCSRDPTVNSWDWYFEPVNHGLEPA